MNPDFIDYSRGTPIILKSTLAHPELRLGIVCEEHPEIVPRYYWRLFGKLVYYTQQGKKEYALHKTFLQRFRNKINLINPLSNIIV